MCVCDIDDVMVIFFVLKLLELDVIVFIIIYGNVWIFIVIVNVFYLVGIIFYYV